jgi:histidinol-phosphate aminotransferase
MFKKNSTAVKARAALTKISDYRPARTLESVKREYGFSDVIKLAGNENRLGCSPLALEAVKNSSLLSYYPDMNCTRLREKLSLVHKTDKDNFIFGNGSFELISIVAQTFLEAGDESIIPVPSFGWYANVTLQMNAVPVYVSLTDFKIDLDSIQERITDKTKIIWICNPNNPTGTIIKHSDLVNFLDAVRNNIVVVLDEAYIDFISEDYPDTVSLLKKYTNIILLRTFSKIYGLASFRIGYGITNPEIIRSMNKVRIPINVNTLAQEAAFASLDDLEFRKKVLENNKDGLELYYTGLEKLGLNYVRSNGNFILFDTGRDCLWIESEFLKRRIVIRPAAEFGLPTWVRISIGTRDDNVEVLKVLTEIVQQ